jgi:DNA-binding SARP family transcriptional activator/tetratricopeptide (TPR) repeat protein
MRVAVLGPLCVDGDPGRLSRRDRVVLSVLTIRRPGFVPPAELAEALWPVHPPSSWAKVVQGCVVRLRRELGPETIVTTPTGYQLALDDAEVDAASFERTVERARGLVDSGELARAHALLESALGLWRGPPLSDLSGWPPGEIEASRLDVVGAEAKELMVEAGIGAGRAPAVLPTARVLVAELPASERRAVLLARAQYLGGEQAQALTTLRRLRRTLRDEGLEPGQAVGRLERAILAHDPDLAVAAQERPTGWERPPLPSRWRSEAPRFVGRRRDLDALEAAWQAVTRGARRVALVGGDAGAGKSRLVAEVGVTTYAVGAVVLLGQCSPELERPYQPFVEPLRVLVDAASTGDLVLPAATRTRTIERVGHVVGERSHPAGRATPVASRPFAGDRLSVAVVDLVRAATRTRPVVLILEDLHWAGAATLELLEHLVIETADDRLLVLATHCHTPPARSPATVATMARLERLDGVEALELGPLTASDIESYVTDELGATPTQARRAGRLLREQSAGNPFFLREIVRELERHGGLTALGTTPLIAPTVVLDIYDQRLGRLTPDDRHTLEVAAVVGQEFDVDVVAAATGVDTAAVLRAADAGAAIGIVDARPGGDGRVGFVHEIARQAVQQLLRPGTLVATHLSIARALEAGFPDAPDVIERLAHHYAAGHSTGHRDAAQKYLREAARRATGRLAHADAAALLERAIQLSPRGSVTDELRLDASAASRRAGDYEAATRHASTVLSSADPRARLRAAVAYEDAAFRGGQPAEDTVERLQGALDFALTADPPLEPSDPLLIRARASLARTLGQGMRLDDRSPVFGELIRAARESGDAPLLAHVLEAAVALPPPWGAEAAEVRLARARELGAVARRIGDSDALVWSAMSRAVTAYVLGRPDEVREAKAVAHAAARISGTATAEQVVMCQGYARAMELGDLDRAEAFADQAGTISPVVGRFEGASATQRFLLDRERLSFERMRPGVSGEERSTDVWAPGMLALYRELGMRTSARRLLDEALVGGLTPWRSLGTWELALVFFTECILWLADRELALEMRSHLELLSGHSVVLGPMVATFGAADRYLGSVEALLGSPRADALLRRAVELDRSMDAPLHEGYSLVALLGSRELAGHRVGGDAALREELDQLARDLDVPRLTAAVGQLDPARGTVEPPPG